MSFEQAARDIERKARKLEERLIQAEQKNLEDVRDTAIRWSSGTDRSRPRKKLLPINKISGVFLSSFRQQDASLSDGSIRSALWNEAPHAVFLEKGTTWPDGSIRMQARPLAEKVLDETTERIDKRRERAIDEALR